MKIIKYILISIVCILLTAGCKSNHRKEDINKTDHEFTQLEKDLKFLTSDECDGRRPGTQGNELAGKYIAYRFNEIGLAPLATDYKLPYTKETETLDPSNICLEILDDGKVVEELIYGEDYFEFNLKNCDITLPLLKELDKSDYALLADNLDTASKYRQDPYLKFILRKDVKLRRGLDFYNEKRQPELHILQSGYDKLNKHIGKSVHFSCKLDVKDYIQNNVAGLMKGSNNRSALIISAHYDHVGSVSDIIWRGALDNASGVCTLIDTAEVVKNLYGSSLPPYDIIFVAFNSEEDMIETGSSFFIRQMSESYQSIFDINIDCIGNKGAEALYIYGNETDASSQIKNGFIKSLSAAEIGNVEEYPDVCAGDHQLFTDAVCLTTLVDTSIIHTPEDTSDKIDHEYLGHISHALGSYIVDELDMGLIFSVLESTEKDDGAAIQYPGDERKPLTVEEFEDKYHCELSFSDEYLREIQIGGTRPLLSDNKYNATGTKNLSLGDIRLVRFLYDKDQYNIKDDVMIYYQTFDKNNSLEMSIKDETLKQNGYSLDHLSPLIKIGEQDYYLPAEGTSDSVQLSTYYENDKIFLWVSIYFRIDCKNDAFSQNDYMNNYLEYVPEQYISGMSELLLGYYE